MQESDTSPSNKTLEEKTAESRTLEDSLRYYEPTTTDDSIASASKKESTTSAATGNVEVEETLDGFRSDQRVRLLRDTTLMLLMLIMLFASLAVYFSQTSSEHDYFKKAFEDQASEFGHALRSQLESKLLALNAFSVSITSYSRLQESSSWPNITIPDFAERASSTLRASKGISLAMYPLVKGEELTEWEEYSVQSQDWLQESIGFLSRQSPPTDEQMRTTNASPISQFVYRVEDSAPAKVQDSTWLLPLWEHFPAHDGLPPVNYDAMTDVHHRYALDEVLQNGEAVMGQAFDLSGSFHGLAIDVLNEDLYELGWSEIWNRSITSTNSNSTPTTTQSPVTPSPGRGYGKIRRKLRKSHLDRTNPDAVVHEDDFLRPPEDKLKDLPDKKSRQHDEEGPAVSIWYPVFLDHSDNHAEVAAVVCLTASLTSFFDPGLLRSNGLVLVITNGCKQAMSFEFVGGEAVYLGPEDLHDPDVEQYEQEFNLILSDDLRLSPTFCPYRAFVYPSSEMRQDYSSGRATFFSIVIAMAFLFTIAVFMAYVYLVNQHQTNLADTATKTTAIVSSLFSKIVRDRLFEEQERSPTSTKKQLVSKSVSSSNLEGSDVSPPGKQGTIADLFPNTTVMFGDIAGFTAWSSSRQPSEVFMLLENLYGALDKLARPMGVFKVETIGDCYVAVTGLPTPQTDHHIRMVKFGRHALQKVAVVTQEMEVSLGPDTGKLGFRIGLHSGPVTAGVLRGEKSRFQLFGDTVNTASRMESTGSQNQIQVSQATADLLVASGKVHWMKKREELVDAKGKGKVQTYWIKSSCKSSDDGEPFQLDRETSLSLVVTQMQPKTKRRASDCKLSPVRQSTIDWQVELLSKILKRIVAHRSLREPKEMKPFNYAESPTKSMPRNNIAEKISMPAFNFSMKESAMMGSVELRPTVMKQLEDLLATFAELYRENNFHNFDHACHVTMSANKLLQRIISQTHDDTKEAHDYTFGLTSDPMTQFAILFSALIHDLDHSGVSNQQLTKEQNRLAIMYGGKSVAEQNSIDLAFEVLSSPSYSDLVSCICTDEKEFARFKQLVINCVIATDIFDKDLVLFRNSRWSKAFSSEDESVSDLKATIVIEHIIQAADVAHTMQHWHVYCKWNEKLFAEMCTAYESGRGPANNPADGWYEGELWFFDNYVIPLAKKLDECGVFGVSSDECLNYALENRNEWEEKGKQVVEEYREKYCQTKLC